MSLSDYAAHVVGVNFNMPYRHLADDLLRFDCAWVETGLNVLSIFYVIRLHTVQTHEICL